MNLLATFRMKAKLLKAAAAALGLMTVSGWALADTVNRATVTAPAGIVDTDTANNTSTDTNTVTALSDLVVTKDNGVTSLMAGGTTTYVLRVTNTGPSSVTGATLVDAAATGLSKTAVVCSAAASNQCSTAPTIANLEAGTVSLPALASGAFYELNVTANVTATSGSVTNAATATVPVGTTDPNTANNTNITDTDTVNPVADLVMTKLDGVTNVAAGGSTTYTVRVTNNGPSPVTGATFSDPAATGLSKTAVACSGTPGQCVTAPTVAEVESGTFLLPTLASGQFYEVTIAATVTATSGTVTNAATATVPVGTTDPTPGDATATDLNTVDPVADLVMTKLDGVTNVAAGGSTTYTVRVTNNGPSSVTGATFTDPAATGLSKTAVACSGTPGQCVTAPTIVEVESGTFLLPTLASGQFYEVTIAATVTATSGTVTNAATATVPVGTTDPTPGDATATDLNTVDPVADLVMVKSNGGTTVTSGTTTTYTMTVTNNGPSTATGAVVTDTVGSNLNCPATNSVSITGDGVPAGTFTVGDLTGAGITLGTLGPGQTATLNFTCNIP